MGPGFLEKVYLNAMVNRLHRKGFKTEPGKQILVRGEDGTVIGEYFADVVVNDCVVAELKAAKALAKEHEAQILNYLKAGDVLVGLLINFGAPRLKVRRFVVNPRSSVCSVSSVVRPSLSPP